MLYRFAIAFIAAGMITASAGAQEADAPKENATPSAAESSPGTAPARKATGPLNMTQRLREADANKDMRVTQEELKAAMPEQADTLFPRLDRNKDGAIDHKDSAAAGGKRGGGLLRRADKDGDGKVTAEEYAAQYPDAHEQQFTTLDKNKDGVLSQQDFDLAAQHQTRRQRPLFETADKDKDGKVTREEFDKAFPKAAKDRFAALDKNGDGTIERPELAPAKPAAKPAGATLENWPSVLTKTLEENDADKDGKVTLEEMQAKKPGFTEAAFSRFDTNKDGVITSEDPAPKMQPRSRRQGAQSPQRRLQHADKDGDGRVSFEEAAKVFTRLDKSTFEKRDRDGDGYWTDSDRKGDKSSGPAKKSQTEMKKESKEAPEE